MTNRKIQLLFIFFIVGQLVLAQNTERFKKSSKKEEAPVQTDEEPVIRGREVQQPEVSEVTEDGFDWDKLVYGGNISLTFGNNSFIYLAPSVGYRFRENFVAGAGFIYQYARISVAFNQIGGSFQQLSEPIENQIYGPKFFANYFPTDYLFVGTQLEYLNHDLAFFDPNTSNIFIDNVWTPVLFLEGGFTQQIGSKGFVLLGFRYNVLHDIDSPYISPWSPVIGIYF